MSNDVIDNWYNENQSFVIKQPAWMKQALCYGLSGDIFFEEGVRRLVIEAKTYCNRCPVRVDCLEYAIKNDELGIWGGLTTTERRREVRRRIRLRGTSKQTKR